MGKKDRGEERKKKKKREPYRRATPIWKNKRSDLIGNKKGAIHIPIILIVAVLVILFIIILIKAPELCIPFTDKCWRLVPLKISRGFMFWCCLAGFVILQVGLIWGYWQIITRSAKVIRQVIPLIKGWTMRLERYIIRSSA